MDWKLCLIRNGHVYSRQDSLSCRRRQGPYWRTEIQPTMFDSCVRHSAPVTLRFFRQGESGHRGIG